MAMEGDALSSPTYLRGIWALKEQCPPKSGYSRNP